MTYFKLPATIETVSLSNQGINIYYPRIHLTDQTVEYRINEKIVQTIQSMYDEQLSQQVSTHMEMIGHYEIKTNERGILSLVLSNYAYSYPMAHGFTIVKSLTFDIESGKEYTLSELFKSDTDYVSSLSKQVSEQIIERNLPLLDPPFTTIRADQDYYVADKSLIIYFSLYEITPYYVGFPMFPISIYSLQEIIDENGPLFVLSLDIS